MLQPKVETREWNKLELVGQSHFMKPGCSLVSVVTCPPLPLQEVQLLSCAALSEMPQSH